MADLEGQKERPLFYYVNKKDGLEWIRGPLDEMERAFKYEVHTKNKSYYHEFNWPEDIYDPRTGQINMRNVDNRQQDYFIPVRD